MFWPTNDENIIPYHMVWDNMDDFGRNVIIRKVSLEGQLMGTKAMTWAERCVLSGVVARAESAHFVREFMHTWNLAKLMTTFAPSLCSPTGQTLNVSDLLFCHGDRLDWVGLRFPLDEQTETADLFRLAAENKLKYGALADRFCFVNPVFGTIEIKNNSETLCRDIVNNDIDRKKLIFHAKKFNGWSLFWKYDELPTPLDWANSVMPSRDFDWKWEGFFGTDAHLFGSDSASKDRYQVIVDEVFQAYPDGKKDSWSIVERRTGHSRRNIVRALKALDRADWSEKDGHT